VWLMRQAGRYMAEFRAYSDKYPFRMRSETPDIAIELSLQPWRAFKPDGVIFFSDILTPLPALGIEFDVIKGKGPRIEVRQEAVAATTTPAVRANACMFAACLPAWPAAWLVCWAWVSIVRANHFPPCGHRRRHPLARQLTCTK
jgi:hypothetical protein